MMKKDAVSKKKKVLYMIELSLISVFFAEVIAGSMPFPYFDIWGYFVVIPLYGIHTILLLKLITSRVHQKRILITTLLIAGGLFGLYEAYITKVLWTGLNTDAFILMDIAIIDFIVLVFFWHPVMSFIIPILVFEKVFTSTRYIYDGLPKFIQTFLSRKYGYVGLFLLIGFFSTLNGQLETLFLSKFVMLLPIFILGIYLRKGEIPTFEELLPKRKGTVIISVYLSLIYIGLGLYVKPKVLTVNNQLVMLVIYIFFIILLYFSIKRNKKEVSYSSNHTLLPLKNIFIASAVLLFFGTILLLVLVTLGMHTLSVMLIWISWIVLGICFFVYSFTICFTQNVS